MNKVDIYHLQFKCTESTTFFGRYCTGVFA